jgi:hypothetical protein
MAYIYKMGEYGADWDKMGDCRDDICNKNYNKEIYNHHNIW